MIVGYARVSTDGQTLDAQQSALCEAGAERVFAEKISGTVTERKALGRAIAALGPGDTLIVTKLDRLARSTRDLLNTLDAVAKAGATFRSLGDSWADTTTPTSTGPRIGKKEPRPAQVWSGRRLPFVTPVPRSIKGQAREPSQTSLWRKCEARQKDGPERQSGARLAMMPIRREDTAKMGTRSLSPLRGRPLAKTRYFQGSRNRARKRTCHLRQTADSGPRPKRASYL